MTSPLSSLFPLVIVGVALVEVSSGGLYTFTDLGLGQANAINDAGVVVGTTLPNRGFVWSAGSLVEIGEPNTALFDINNQGAVAGIGPGGPFVWQNGSFTYLPELSPNTGGRPSAINDRGTIVGIGTALDGKARSVIWSNGSNGYSISELPRLPGTELENFQNAQAINDDGQAVGSSGPHGVLWNQGGVQDIGSGLVPYGINNTGQVVGREHIVGFGDEAFLWENGVTQHLHEWHNRSWAMAINDSGMIVGAADLTADPHAFLWSRESGWFYLHDLTVDIPDGWRLHWATDINELGQIVGSAFDQNGYAHGFLVTPSAVPEPSTVAICSVSLIVVFVRSRAGRWLKPRVRSQYDVSFRGFTT